jgi:hypothetical protein
MIDFFQSSQVSEALSFCIADFIAMNVHLFTSMLLHTRKQVRLSNYHNLIHAFHMYAETLLSTLTVQRAWFRRISTVTPTVNEVDIYHWKI